MSQWYSVQLVCLSSYVTPIGRNQKKKFQVASVTDWWRPFLVSFLWLYSVFSLISLTFYTFWCPNVPTLLSNSSIHLETFFLPQYVFQVTMSHRVLGKTWFSFTLPHDTHVKVTCSHKIIIEYFCGNTVLPQNRYYTDSCFCLLGSKSDLFSQLPQARINEGKTEARIQGKKMRGDSNLQCKNNQPRKTVP